MIWADANFPYGDYKGKGHLFETFATDEYDEKEDRFSDYAKIKWQIDYSEELGMYRITRFKDNHWDGDLVFDEIKNAYCPICDKTRYIPDKIKIGYCCKCGHHLNRSENNE